mgnify:CR=1 FL=1
MIRAGGIRATVILSLLSCAAVVGAGHGHSDAAVCPAGYKDMGKVWVDVSTKTASPTSAFSYTVPINTKGTLADTRVMVKPASTASYSLVSDVGAGLGGTRVQTKTSSGAAVYFTYSNTYATTTSTKKITLTVTVTSKTAGVASSAVVTTQHAYEKCTSTTITPNLKYVSLGANFFV